MGSKLLGEEKRDDTVKVLTVAEATVTKVIEDAKLKIAENSSNKTLPIAEDAEQDDERVKDTAKEVDIKSDILEGQNAEQASSKESSPSWRDEKGGAKGLRAKLLEGKAEGEGAVVDNEALRSAAEATVTKVIADAKQKVSEDESSGTVGIGDNKEIEINKEGDKDEGTPSGEQKAGQALNMKDEKDGAKGLKTILQGEKEKDIKKSVEEEEEVDTMTTFVGSLKIKIHQAEDLEKKDLVQKADPYVVVRFGSQESKSEKVKNSLSPVWNHETALDLQRASPRMIEIQLMDWERIGKDEPMGKVLLPVGEAVKKRDNFWMDLQDCKSGKILISTEFSGSDAKAVIGGGVKELRDMLKSDKSNTESDEKGLTLEPKDGLTPSKTENDDEEA